MKKLCLLAILQIVVIWPSVAIDHVALLSLVNMNTGTTTPDKVTAVLGQPVRIEESRKRTTWYYDHGDANMKVSWSNRSDALLKFSYKCTTSARPAFDSRLAFKLKSGATNIDQAVKILGLPKDITIKEKTQEMHYAYEKKVLRLFFRDHILVDYCLY